MNSWSEHSHRYFLNLYDKQDVSMFSNAMWFSSEVCQRKFVSRNVYSITQRSVVFKEFPLKVRKESSFNVSWITSISENFIEIFCSLPSKYLRNQFLTKAMKQNTQLMAHKMRLSKEPYMWWTLQSSTQILTYFNSPFSFCFATGSHLSCGERG